MVQARLIESISRRGEELQAGLPPIWREALDKALETFLKAGRSPEDIAGARLAVSELIRERLLG